MNHVDLEDKVAFKAVVLAVTNSQDSAIGLIEKFQSVQESGEDILNRRLNKKYAISEILQILKTIPNEQPETLGDANINADTVRAIPEVTQLMSQLIYLKNHNQTLDKMEEFQISSQEPGLVGSSYIPELKPSPKCYKQMTYSPVHTIQDGNSKTLFSCLDDFNKNSGFKNSLWGQTQSISYENDKSSEEHFFRNSKNDLNTGKHQMSLFCFHELSKLLKGIFLGHIDVKADSKITIEEAIILTAIFHKKFGISLLPMNIYSYPELLACNEAKIRRRPEECYKFVFKYCIKSLKLKYQQNNPKFLNIKTPGFLDSFYTHFFGETSSQTGFALNNFYLPLTPEGKKNQRYSVIANTINSKYVRFVAQNHNFISDFLFYLNERFLTDYKRMISDKIDALCSRWGQSFVESSDNYRIVDNICDSIIENVRCKLPWTTKEVEYAIDLVNSLVAGAISRKKKSLDENEEIDTTNL